MHVSCFSSLTDFEPLLVPVECRIDYNSETWVAFYDVTIPICTWYFIYGDFFKNLSLVDFTIDIVTLGRVQRMKRPFRSGRRSENYTKNKQPRLLLLDRLLFLLDGRRDEHEQVRGILHELVCHRN